MMKLHQVIATLPNYQGRRDAVAGETYKENQKPTLFNGFHSKYRPIDEAGTQLPPESKVVDRKMTDQVAKLRAALSPFLDIAASRDWSNMKAVADVKVGEKVILSSAPVTFLMFLEKQLIDIRTWIGKIPTLETSESWTFDENSGQYRSDPVQTHRNEKDAVPVVLYDATPEHPAQTQLVEKPVLVGYWDKTKFSGAMSEKDKESMRGRVEALLVAVKSAREEANGIDADTPTVSSQILTHIFG